MPAYEMTAAEQQEYGNSLTIWQAIKLLQTWAPLANYAREFLATVDPFKKSLVVAQAGEWMASKTDSPVDDQLVRLLADVLKTTQGEALLRFCVAQVGVK